MSAEATGFRVFLVEDDEAVRRSMKYQIEGMGYTVHAFPSALSFLDDYKPSEQTCLLLDVRMPGMTGIELQQKLVTDGDTIPVIMISGHADVPAAVRAMKNGASDFLSKPVSGDDLQAALKFAFETPVVEGRRCDVSVEEIRERMEQLTPRELQVLSYVVDGHSSRQIAEQLEVSFKTIDAHRSKIMTKIKAQNVAHLVRMCLSEQVSAG
ncbi:MAG: response regulator transcription factor [Planctomycetaceae bacterium]